MVKDNFILKRNNQSIFVYKWSPDPQIEIKSVLYIAHGMAEHALRYERLAEQFTKQGFVVYANDHRGHGKTAGDTSNVGYITDNNGWFEMVDDVHAIYQQIITEHQQIPVFILGHSMGSMIIRSYLIKYKSNLTGVILCGTSGSARFLEVMGRFVIKIMKLFYKKRIPSKFLNQITFGKFNSAIKNPKTPFDWLSRDPIEVEKYLNDPYCGGIFSIEFFANLLTGASHINNFTNINQGNKDTPLLIISGSADPVGLNTIGIKKVISLYKKAETKNLEFKFYENARHELFNEINKEEITADTLKWINKILDMQKNK